MTRVLIADDHVPTRASIRDALESSGFTVCAEVGDASAAVAAAMEELPDVCLLDIWMPGGGIAAAWEIAARLPDTKVVMLTISSSDRHLFAALKAGASGYLLKGMEPSRLVVALETVVKGEAALPRALVGRLIDEFRERGPRRRVLLTRGGRSQLTSREWEVLELLREGLATGQIAERLVVAPVTVRSHIAAILKKLRVSDRASAVGLIEGAGDSPGRTGTHAS
jgi:DNA-binding NarL/FixJ family response regulator